MDEALLISMAVASFRAATPLLLAALGELVCEKSGMLNLGVEGMMLVGAVSGFIACYVTGSPALGVLAAILAGCLLSLLYGVLTIHLAANQVATGLAITIFGTGLSAFVGSSFVGQPIEGLQPIVIPGLSSIPVLGPILFAQDILVYVALLATLVVAWVLTKTRWGLILRAVGESPETAQSLGQPVFRIRYCAVMFGGAMAGLGGGYLSLVYTPLWIENMAAGRGWIALALVVFASWKPLWVALGALLFGAVSILQLFMQGLGVEVSSHLLSMLPYITTVIVLVLISRDGGRLQLSAPASLGKAYRPSL